MTVTEVNANGIPVSPPKAPARFRTICGILGRERVPITTLSWDTVSDDRKGQLWDEVLKSLTFPEADKARVERQALTSVTVIRPGGIFDIPLPSRVRTTFLGDPDAFGDVDDGGEDGADAISLTCYLYKLNTQ